MNALGLIGVMSSYHADPKASLLRTGETIVGVSLAESCHADATADAFADFIRKDQLKIMRVSCQLGSKMGLVDAERRTWGSLEDGTHNSSPALSSTSKLRFLRKLGIFRL